MTVDDEDAVLVVKNNIQLPAPSLHGMLLDISTYPIARTDIEAGNGRVEHSASLIGPGQAAAGH